MKIKRIIKRLLCFALASIFMFCLSFSGAATEIEIENTETADNDIEFENIGTIGSDIEIGDIEPIDEFVYYEGDILEGQIAEFSGYGDASVLTDANTTKTEEEMTINLLGLGYGSESNFKPLFTNNELLLDNDPPGYYFGMQGGCTDGEYNYFAFIVKDASQTHMDTRIVCYKIDEPESTRTLYWTKGLKTKLQHINDMTYNSITGEIVIACCYGGYYQQLYTINATELQNESSQKNFVRHNVSCMVTSIGFNETRNQYVVGLSKQTNYMAILDSDFNLIKKVGYEVQENDDNWSGQGLHCDNKYIYLTQFDLIEGTDRSITDPNESRIKIFDWNGNHKRTIKFEVDKKATEENLKEGEPSKNKRYCEVENMFVVDNRVYLGFNCLYNKKHREFTYIDITNYTYYIQYCPDENVENYYEKIGEDYFAKDNNNVKAVMIKGLETNLYRSRIAIAGKKFNGWTAYRANVNQWLYKKAGAIDSSTNIWCFEGQQPEGYIKYVYRDTQEVANTGLGGELVLMCAQWEDATEFTVRFFSNGGTGTMDNLNVVHGVSTPLSANTFTKDDLDFKWWNAYWPEKNMWYYRKISDINDRGWFVEGCEPEGYIKYRYSDEQSVAQTVYAGSNVYMYAVWNEFTVYYNANGVEVEAEGIIDSEIAVHKEKFENYLKSYSTTGLSSKYSAYQLKGYYQYWVEEDKWMCMDDTGKPTTWYSQADIDKNGLKKYIRNPSSYISTTVREGEHLVLYAVWSKS